MNDDGKTVKYESLTKIEILQKQIENLERQRLKPENKFDLKPDKYTLHETNRAHSDALERQICELNDELKQFTMEREETSPPKEAEKSQIPHEKPQHFHWQRDPSDMAESNVLAREETGLCIAQVELPQNSQNINSHEIQAKLFLYNTVLNRWQDGGVHNYDNAISCAEK